MCDVQASVFSVSVADSRLAFDSENYLLSLCSPIISLFFVFLLNAQFLKKR